MHGGPSPQAQAEIVLKGLGFKADELQRPTGTFSQGWNMRIELAKILLRKPDVLLLDEPTNHLDIESIQWLEEYLQGFPGTIPRPQVPRQLHRPHGGDNPRPGI